MLRLSCGAVLAALATPAFATDEPPPVELAGTAALVSDYRFRGISLSNRGPALQGSVTAAHPSGLYATAWASNVDGFGQLGGSNLELDVSAGYRFSRGATTFDAGLLYYAYPGSSGGNFEFFEPYASITHRSGRMTGRLSAAFAPAQAAIGDGSNIYVAGDVSLSTQSAPITVKAHLGRSEGETTLSIGSGYTEWSVGLEAAFHGMTLGLAYIDTDISDADALEAGARVRDVGASVVFSLAATF